MYFKSQRGLVSHGQEETKLLVWYDIEDIKNAIPGWTEPIKPIYENTKKFYRGLRMPEVGNNGKTIITRNNKKRGIITINLLAKQIITAMEHPITT